MQVYLAQLKCPSNHSVVAAAGECESAEAARALLIPQVSERFQALTESKAIRKTCGICGSSDLHVEVGPTRFATMQEAGLPWFRSDSLLVQAAAVRNNGKARP